MAGSSLWSYKSNCVLIIKCSSSRGKVGIWVNSWKIHFRNPDKVVAQPCKIDFLINSARCMRQVFHLLLGDESETDNQSNTFYDARSPPPTFTFLLLLPTTCFVYRATRVCAYNIIGRLTKVAHSLVKLNVAVMNFSNSCGSTRCVSAQRVVNRIGLSTQLGQNWHGNWNIQMRDNPILSSTGGVFNGNRH